MRIFSDQVSGLRTGAIRSAGMCLSIIAVMMAACGSGDPDFQIIDTLATQDGPIVLEYAPSGLALGPATIRLRLDVEKSDTLLYEGKISNDGGAITAENIQVDTSKQGYLRLCLNGVEQADIAVRIELATGLVIEEERHCSD